MSSVKLTVVGYWGGYPGVNEATSGYLVEKDGFSLLIDCGSGVLSKLQNYISPEKISAVILSHYHHDHIADIGPLQYARLISSFIGKKTNNLPIYAPKGVEPEQFVKLTHAHTTGVAYDPQETVSIGPFEISFMQTAHPVACYAMRITDGEKVIIYTADSSYKQEFSSFANKADLLICECNLYKHQNGKNQGHMNSHDAGTIAKDAGVSKLLLTHLPHFGDVNLLPEEASEIYNGEIILANNGWVWS